MAPFRFVEHRRDLSPEVPKASPIILPSYRRHLSPKPPKKSPIILPWHDGWESKATADAPEKTPLIPREPAKIPFIPPEIMLNIFQELWLEGDHCTSTCLGLTCHNFYDLHKSSDKNRVSLASRSFRTLTLEEKKRNPAGVLFIGRPLYQLLERWKGAKLKYSPRSERFVNRPSHWQVLIKKPLRWTWTKIKNSKLLGAKFHEYKPPTNDSRFNTGENWRYAAMLRRKEGTDIYCRFENPFQSLPELSFFFFLRTGRAPYAFGEWVSQPRVVEVIPSSAGIIRFGEWDPSDFPAWWWKGNGQDVERTVYTIKRFGGLSPRDRQMQTGVTTDAYVTSSGVFLTMEFV